MLKSRTFAALTLAAGAAYASGALAENGEVGRQMRDGALAYLGTVNRQGGINGRKIELITLDDAGQTKVGEANTKKLIEENKVFLLFGYTGRNTSEAALPII